MSRMKSSYPHPNPTHSYWIEEGPNGLKNHRTTPELPEYSDVVIIGSGYSGCSVASNMYLERVLPNKQSVVMLEGRDVCSGASGRNGGHIRSFYHTHQKQYIDSYGKQIAAQLAVFEHEEIFKVKKLTEKHKIDCDFDFRTSCQTFNDPKTVATALDNFYAFQNNEFIPKNIRNLVKIHFQPESNEVSEHNTNSFVITAPTCSVWPYKLITSLLLKCIEKGLNLQTYTMVETVKPYSSEDIKDGWIVQTNRGTIKCKKIVCATNAWTRALLPEFRNKIVPVKGCVSHIKPQSKTTGKLKYNYYHTFQHESDYVTAHKDMSMIAGGGGPTYLNYPNSIEMFNNADDSYAPEETLRYFENYPNKMYPGFAKDLKFVNDYTWTGCMAYTNDEFPFVGDLSPFGRKNMYIIAGFTGHGMPRIWSCGKFVAGLLEGYSKVTIPSVFLPTLERMYSQKEGVLDYLTGYDNCNRGHFKL